MSEDSPRNGELRKSLRASEAREASSRREAFEASAWLSAIIENSDDAILSKNLNGLITSWNPGAPRLFGYSANEAIGQHITIIIPDDRLSEEDAIISRIRRGERVDHFETVRQRKDGSFIDIALSVSPVRNEAGEIIGASKIARDISQAMRAAERQALILREMNHRIKNLFAMTTGLVALSARGAGSVDGLAQDLTTRIGSLARAHDLILPDLSGDVLEGRATTLRALLDTVLAPHQHDRESKISVTGCDVPVGARAIPSLALLFHEFATNAAKYGAFADAEGRLAIDVSTADAALTLIWSETTERALPETLGREGFGSRLERATIKNLGGALDRDWQPKGLLIRLSIPLRYLAD